jgi:cytochrome oxidase Cu insertion factor (SCO1/SenC/PrrC family)
MKSSSAAASFLGTPIHRLERNGLNRVVKSTCSIVLIFAFGLSSLAFATPVAASADRKTVYYVCPMDTEVRATRPGKCPKCGMALRKSVGEPIAAVAEPEKPNASPASVNLARLPDTMVYDQNGRRLSFYNDLVKGKTVAINFLFTTCTTICPPMAATFRKVQQELGDRVGRDISLISISVDPATDVPERLKKFAAKFNAGPGWTFVTGSPPEIDRLLKALGAAVADKNDHTPMVLVGNEAAGYWTRTYGLAAPTEIVKAITNASARTEDRTEEKAATLEVPLPPDSVTSAQNEIQIQKTVDSAAATGSTGAPAPAEEVKKTKTPAEKAAAYFPNTVLYTQDNRPVHFFDDLLKGKTVMINFMFTTCTGICPPMTANLLKVQSYLGDRVGKDVNIISISVDPAIDTPAALKRYATNFKVKPGWYFLTGKKADVDLVLSKVGGLVKDKSEHSGLIMIGSVETGEWIKIFAMARPAEIADAVLKIAGSKQE